VNSKVVVVGTVGEGSRVGVGVGDGVGVVVVVGGIDAFGAGGVRVGAGSFVAVGDGF